MMVFFTFIFVFCLGAMYFHYFDKKVPTSLEALVGSSVDLSGVIIDEPDKRENNQKLTIKIDEKYEQVKTKILATVPLEREYKYGDKVDISGILEKPENFTTHQEKNFDYINYLRKDKIFYLMNYPYVDVVESGGGNIIKRHLFSFKKKFLDKIDFAVSKPESLLLGGLILGERASFSAELRQEFIDTGTIHIVALSGYNVTIIAEWIIKIFAFLPLGLAFSFGILGILLFVIMAGGMPTAVRAGTMAVLALVARATSRDYDVGRGLVLAGVLMILSNPFVLAYDVSFQLSFVATIAVIYLAPRWEKYFMWVTKRFNLRDVLSVTFSAYVFVLPFILYKMGNLSLTALPANILVLPFIPITMFFGFMTGFFGLFWSYLSLPFGYIAYLLLHYELSVIHFLANLSFSAFVVPDFPLFLVLIFYIYFIYYLFGGPIKQFFKKEF